MRLTVMAFTISSVFAACGTKTDKVKETARIDSSVFYKDQTASDTAKVTEPLPAGTNRTVVVETRHADGSSTTTTTTDVKNKTTPATKPVTKPAEVKTPAAVASETKPATTVQPATAAKKKGWSNKAKGAVIGGVGGAAVGAAVSKKKGKGAIIGGVLGAAGGYIIGNEKDKKKKAQ